MKSGGKILDHQNHNAQVLLRAIAQLGGYLNRKCAGPPGFESLWRGYARFHDRVRIINLRNASEANRR